MDRCVLPSLFLTGDTHLTTLPLPFSGWFPILFFTSVWVSDIHTRAALAMPDSPWKSASDPGLYEEATRAGSRALFWNAVVAFVTAVLMPLLVAKSRPEEDANEPGWLEKLGVPERVVDWVGRWKGLSLGWVWVGSHVSLGDVATRTLRPGALIESLFMRCRPCSLWRCS